MRRMLAAAAFVAAGAALTAQTFDAASIRTVREPVFERGRIGMQPGRLVAQEATLPELIAEAFGIRDNQVLGAADWMLSQRFNVTATATSATPAVVQAMLRALLADCFGLQTHREMRPLPIYTLTLLRDEGRLGARLKRSGPECAPPSPPPGVPMPPAPRPSADVPLTPLTPRASMRCPTMFFTGMISARAMTIEALVDRLTQILVRPVIDRTGLTGEFDVDLYYQTGVSPGGDTGIDPSAPALMSAVQDQLGLKLEAGRAPVEVVIVDAARRPSED